MNISRHILAHEGWISMDNFMEAALFDETEGYYSSNIPGIGGRGDFATCATQSSLLARGIILQWKRACKACGCRLPFIEIGGGSADLMLEIARELGFVNRLMCRYLMVEKSPKLRELQRQIGGGFVRCYETIEKALKACKGKAFIFSNELPDAFPARQFVHQEGEWYELGLAYNAEKNEVFRQVWKRDLPDSSAFAQWAQDGQIIEVHESYHQWLRAWQPLWKLGCLLTIDYGDEVKDLYYRRPHGSMRGYKSHQLLSVEELLPLAGKCDITCDVNFTDLLQLARECAGDEIRYMRQADFLHEQARTDDAGDQHLIAIPGAGDHFKVLIQYRFAN